MRSWTLALVATVALVLVSAAAAASGPGSGRTLFVESATENADGTVTLPLYRGTSGGDTVYYIILDTSDGERADALGVNRSQKLENARGTAAVQEVNVAGGVVDFPATVDFAPEHVVEAPSGFPPTTARAGSVGEPGYSPLIERPSGAIDNAPQLARDQNGDGAIALGTEAHDKVVSIDVAGGHVTLRESGGFQGGEPVRYVSTDASFELAAALEESTLAPALAAAPSAGDDGTKSSRASLAAFVNGQTGAANPQRQGLNSAVAGDGDPLNVLFWNPSQGRYSPLWDVHLSAWTPAAIAAGRNVRQTDFGKVLGLVDDGLVTGPGGAPFGAADVVVNCPIISRG